MFVLKTKNSNLGKFWKAVDWNILRTFGIFYGHLVHFVLIWYIFPFWVSWTKKNLATLALRPRISRSQSYVFLIYNYNAGVVVG
jgi:hypothetical protein